jgi:hypothetical protein
MTTKLVKKHLFGVNMKTKLIYPVSLVAIMTMIFACSSTKESELEDLDVNEALEEEGNIDESAGIEIDEDETLAAEDYDYSESLSADALTPQNQIANQLAELDQEFEDEGPMVAPQESYMAPSVDSYSFSGDFRVYYVKSSATAHDTSKSAVTSIRLIQGDRVVAKASTDGWLEGQDGYLYKADALTTSVVGRKRMELSWN